MTTTTSPRPTRRPTTAAGHAPSPRTQGWCVAAGGVLFAVGNAMHPLSHSDHAVHSPLWAAAHLVFSAGGVLAAAGVPALLRASAPSRAAVVGWCLLWLGLVLLPVSAFVEVWVAPEVGHEAAERMASSPLLALPTALLWLLGPVLVAVGSLRHRLLAPVVVVGLLLFPVAGLLAGALPPALEGVAVIPGAVAFGAALVAAGTRAARTGAPQAS